MNPIQRRQLMFLEELGGGHVRAQHALFDDLVSIVPGNRDDLFNLAISIEDNLRFRGFEINRATLGPGLTKQLIQTIEVVQLRQHMGVLLTQTITRLGIGIFQHVAHLVIGKPGMTVHHRLIEAVTTDFAGSTDGHVGHHAQAIDTWIQRAQTVGQLLGQHWNHVVREVHRGTAVYRFIIQRRARTDIMGYVCNRNQQAVTTPWSWLAIDRIVEVASGLIINGHQPEVTDINPVFFIFFSDLIRNLGDLLP